MDTLEAIGTAEMAFTTKKSLLKKVDAKDEKAWRDFVEYYTPLIRLRANDLKLTDEEFEDLRQIVLMDVFSKNLVGKYDSSIGKFRTYFRTIITNTAIDILRQRRKNQNIENIELAACDNNLFEEEWQAFIYQKALEQVRKTVDESTYMAFEFYVRRNLPVEQVAEILSISVDSVYQAKSRIARHLKNIIEKLMREEGE